MKYLTDGKEFLYAYDERSGITVRLKDGKWELSPVVYGELARDDRYYAISAEGALALGSGLPLDAKIEELKKFLGI